jgi:hypothetical protein
MDALKLQTWVQAPSAALSLHMVAFWRLILLTAQQRAQCECQSSNAECNVSCHMQRQPGMHDLTLA